MRDRDIAVARVAARQHGVITTQQLRSCGLDRRAVHRRVAAGRLHPLHPGVYAVGHAGVSVQGRYLAAVCAGGEEAVLSHRAAAHLLGLTRGGAADPEITVPMVRPRTIHGVIVHRTRVLHPLERSELDGIPITTVPRTLVDLAGCVDAGALSRAVHEAQVRHAVTPGRVGEVLARAPNRRGARALRALLLGDAPVLLSRLEEGFLAVLAAHALPLPQTNRPAAGDRVDCRWPEHRLVVELDSYRYHHTRYAWEEDRRRERRARAAGDEHRRYCWADVFEDPVPMLAELGALLRPVPPGVD